MVGCNIILLDVGFAGDHSHTVDAGCENLLISYVEMYVLNHRWSLQL